MNLTPVNKEDYNMDEGPISKEGDNNIKIEFNIKIITNLSKMIMMPNPSRFSYKNLIVCKRLFVGIKLIFELIWFYTN